MPTFRKNIALWVTVAVLFTASACKTVYIPVTTTEKVTVRDSVYLRDTVLKVEVEKASLSDFVDLGDTLLLQTDLAVSTAWIEGSTGVLRGTLKQRGELPVKVAWKERIVYRDSVSTKEVPVPVEVEKVVKVVPWFWRFFAVLGIIATAGALFWILRKFKVL